MTTHVTHKPSIPCTLNPVPNGFPSQVEEEPCSPLPQTPSSENGKAFSCPITLYLENLQRAVHHCATSILHQLTPRRVRCKQKIQNLSGALYFKKIHRSDSPQRYADLSSDTLLHYARLDTDEKIWLLRHSDTTIAQTLVELLDTTELHHLTQDLLPQISDLKILTRFVLALENRFSKEHLDNYDAIHESLESLKKRFGPKAYFKLVDRLSPGNIERYLPLLPYRWLMELEANYLSTIDHIDGVKAITHNLTPRQVRYLKQEGYRLPLFTEEDVLKAIKKQPLHLAVIANADSDFAAWLLEVICRDQILTHNTTLSNVEIENILALMAPKRFFRPRIEERLAIEKYVILISLLFSQVPDLHLCLHPQKVALLLENELSNGINSLQGPLWELALTTKKCGTNPSQETLDHCLEELTVLKRYCAQGITLLDPLPQVFWRPKPEILEEIFHRQASDQDHVEELRRYTPIYAMLAIRSLGYDLGRLSKKWAGTNSDYLCTVSLRAYQRISEELRLIEDELIIICHKNNLTWSN